MRSGSNIANNCDVALITELLGWGEVNDDIVTSLLYYIILYYIILYYIILYYIILYYITLHYITSLLQIGQQSLSSSLFLI